MTSTATPPPILSLNTRVSVAAGLGYVRFVGPTRFAAGKWCGIELDQATGKNDGSVAGTRYFTCEEAKGVFVRPSQVRLVVAEEEEGRNESPTPTTVQAKVAAPSMARVSSTASSKASSSRPPSRPTPPTTARPSSASTSRASVETGVRRTTTTRPSSSTGPSGRASSAASTTSERDSAVPRIGSPSKLARASTSSAATTRALGPPAKITSTGTSRVTSGSSSTGNSEPSTSSVGAAGRRPSSSASTSLMGPPPTPLQRRPPSVRSLSNRSSTSPIQNFAPSSLGTPRTLSKPTTASATMSRTSSSSSIVSNSTRGRKESMVASPIASLRPTPASGGAGSRPTEMFRQLSGDAIELRTEEGGFLDDEELIIPDQSSEEEKEEDEDKGTRRINSPVKPDPFSLQHSGRSLAETHVPRREHDELLAKLRILEARRLEDREKLREVDRLREEAEEWNKIKEKTKSKLVELSGEVKELKKINKELKADRDAIEENFEDLNDQVEISLLDKEVAEERFEAVSAQLEMLKEKAAELEVEVTVLREQNAKLEGEGAEAVRSVESGDSKKTSLAYIQLEKQNGRLKDALLRLRDLTSEAETEHRRKIADLEKELDLTSDLQAEFENNLVELERAEAQIEELKAQLDDTLGAEDMLEQLTDKNLSLTEKIEELTTIVEDLEALKELNDELEDSHVETEKQLQDELDMKDLQLQELRSRCDLLEDGILDYERTIGQFRELVGTLQTDLEQLRQHQASQESESQSLTSQSQAMLNLNLKLQSTMLKGQVKTIELELRKLDAKQAGEQLAMIKPYLLPSFFDNDSDAVDALLFFERLSYKSDLVGMLIEQNHSVSEALNSVVPEILVDVCETRAKLARFSALNRKFAANLKRCDSETFLKMGRVYLEVAPTEKRIDAFINALRKEELREVDCGQEVEGLIAQAEHLSETHLAGSVLDLAEREHACVVALDLDFDTIAAAVGFTKQTLATLSKDPDVVLELGDATIDDIVFRPLQNLFNQARNAKVITKKLLRRLDELVSHSSALTLDHAEGFDTLAFNSSAIAGAASKFAATVSSYCAEVRSSKKPFELSAFLKIAKEVAANELGKQTPRPLEEIGALLGQLGQDVGTTLSTSMDQDQVVKLDYDPPWIARVTELQSNAAINVDAERNVQRLNEEMRDLVREIRAKDQAHQESVVKIEVMEKRMESIKKQTEAITELESELVKSKKQERAYEEAIEALQADLDAMEQELAKAKQNIAANEKSGAASGGATGVEGETVVYEGNMETSYLVEQIESLRNAVRFLRSQNSYLKSQDLLTELDALPTYTLPATSPVEPDEPAGLPVSSRRRSPKSPVVPLEPISFAVQSKQLLHEARVLSATPRLIDLSQVRPGGKAAWTPNARLPAIQLKAEKERAKKLSKKFEALWEMRPVMLTVT